jgi:FixJ family two-component response regulator
MNGVQLYKALVASERGLPVIMITGGDETYARRLMQGIDAVALLTKPFDESVLCEAISRARSRSANRSRLP